MKTAASHTTVPSPQPDSPSVVLVADDLTGACDSAVAFARPGCRVLVDLVALDEQTLSSADVVALNTASRDIAPAEAVRRVQHSLSRIPSTATAFKKIDSVFRGNTLAEIVAASRMRQYHLSLLAPAFPSQGRSVSGGVLHVETAEESWTLDLARELTRIGIDLESMPACETSGAAHAALRQAMATGTRLLLCDAVTQRHLDVLVAGAALAGIAPLWIGSSGLAHALNPSRHAQTQPDSAQLRPGHAVFYLGSDHPVTLAQLLALERATGLQANPCHRTTHHDPQAPASLFLVERTTTDAAISAATAGLTPDSIGCLFATGGDTALQICHALGITALQVQQELAPGIPLATAQGGRLHGTPFVLKSGAFGDPTLLCRILSAVHGKELVTR